MPIVLPDLTEAILTGFETRYREQRGQRNFCYAAVSRPPFRQHNGVLLTDLYHMVILGRDHPKPEQLQIVGYIGSKADIEKQAERYNRERLKLSPEDVARILV